MKREDARIKVEMIDSYLLHACQDYGESDHEAMMMAIKALEQARWIPVSERLPNIHNYSENYFVTLKRGNINIAMFTECNGKHWWTYNDVIAWMPLPKPYEQQESEEP